MAKYAFLLQFETNWITRDFTRKRDIFKDGDGFGFTGINDGLGTGWVVSDILDITGRTPAAMLLLKKGTQEILIAGGANLGNSITQENIYIGTRERPLSSRICIWINDSSISSHSYVSGLNFDNTTNLTYTSGDFGKTLDLTNDTNVSALFAPTNINTPLGVGDESAPTSPQTNFTRALLIIDDSDLTITYYSAYVEAFTLHANVVMLSLIHI